MRILLLLSFIIISFTTSVAQTPIEENTEVVGNFRQTFSKLEYAHIPYSALRDRAVELIDFEPFDGLHSDVYSTKNDFVCLLKSARTLFPSYPSWQAEDLLSALYKSSSLTECSMGVLYFNYSYIKENALTDSLISYDGEYVYDVYKDGEWQNPYEKSRIFSMLPSDTLFYNTVNFSFSNDFYRANSGGIFELDPDDGNGFRVVGYGSPNQSLSVTYANAGEHILQLKFTTGSESYITKCKIYTVNQSSSTRALNDEFECRDITSVYQGQTVSGKLWKKGRNSNHLRPFLIVEGFDVYPQNNQNKLSNYGAYGSLSLPKIWNEISFLSNNYDVYYLDLESATLKIEANATLLEEALSKIEDDKANCSSSEDNIIMGSSMGGLITRYCLRDMELRGVSHHTHTMICQDTPNLGANIPLSILYGVHALNKLYGQVYGKFFDGFREPMHLLNSIVYSDAAKEMLINYIDENGNIDNSVYNDFMQRLHSMGYPVGDHGSMRSLAISNGNSSCIDVNSTILKASASFTPTTLGEAIFNIYRDLAGVVMAVISPNLFVSALSMVLGSTKFDCHAELYPVGSTLSNQLIHFTIHYKKKVLWIANFSAKFFHYQKSQPSDIVNYDIARTSYYDVSNLQESISPNLNYKIDPFGIYFADVDAEVYCVRQIPFIPTVSALDVGEYKSSITQSDLNRTYSMDGARPGGDKYIPFDGYYITASTDKHISITPEIVSWLYSQFQLRVEGDDVAVTGAKYTLINNTKGLSVNWSSSDNSVATINQDGVVTAYKHGYVTLKATLSNGLSFPKRVMIGFPKYNLSIYNESNYVRFTCEQYSDNSVELKKFLPYIKLQVAGSDIVFSDTNVNYYDVDRTNNGRASVYFRPAYTAKNKDIYGEVVSATVCTAYPYVLEPNYFILSQYHGVSTVTIKQNPFYYDTLPDEFKIYYFESHGGIGFNASGANSLDVSVENVFSADQIKSFKNNASVRSISNDFIIRGRKGNIIQKFKITYVR